MPRPDLDPIPDPKPTPAAKPAPLPAPTLTRAKAPRAAAAAATLPEPAATTLPPYIWHWLALGAVVIGYLVSLIVFPPIFAEPSVKASNWVLFIGRFHPILLHMPVGALILLLTMEIICLRRSMEEQWGDAALFISLFNATTSVVAVVAGLMLSREGFSGSAFTLHTYFGIAIGFGAIIAALMRLWFMTTNGEGKLLQEANRFFLLLTFTAMTVGAHFGANMVHGNKYLTEFAPKPFVEATEAMENFMIGFVTKKKEPEKKPEPTGAKAPPSQAKPTLPDPNMATGDTMAQIVANQPVKIAPPAPPNPTMPEPAPASTTPAPAAGGGEKLAFQHVVLPLLEAKCNSCHNEQKTKGKLRMDTYDLLMAGGQDTVKTVIPGNVAGSLGIIRIELPMDEDEHMPPSNKDQFTPEELALFKHWIAAGASSTQTVAEAKFPPALQATVDALLKK